MLSDAEDPLPDRQTQQHLLDLYWTYVHPHFPIVSTSVTKPRHLERRLTVGVYL